MIKNGRPYTNENGYVDADLITDHHSEEEIEEICKWIKSTLIPGKLFNFNYSSYSLKHILECDTGIYLTNNEFKDAMQKCGFKPDNPNDLNWCYRISNNSPALNEHDYADDGKITKHHSEKEVNVVCNWIRAALIPKKTPNSGCKNKMLKDMVERDTGITLTMNEFRTAMRMCGYLPVNPQKIDCYYRISKKSPVLQDEWTYSVSANVGNAVRTK